MSRSKSSRTPTTEEGDSTSSIDPTGITFMGLFAKASTTIDGGWIISFTVNQDEAHKIVQASTFKDVPLQVAIIPLSLGEMGHFPEF